MHKSFIILSLFLCFVVGGIISFAFGYAPSYGQDVGIVAPQITQVWPKSGGQGQYITLEGRFFGPTAAKVFFVRRGFEVPASFSFPTKCQGQFWRDSYVVLRVPQSIEAGNYSLKVVRSDGQESNLSDFTVTTAPPGPGLCGALPDNGPAGIPVRLYGERFGDERGRVVIGTSDAVIADRGWSDEFIESSTPVLSPASGRLRVVDSSNNLSNPIFFTTQRCTPSSCGQGLTCCGDGSCRPLGMCTDQVAQCQYVWSFYTGQRAHVGEQCGRNEQCFSGVCENGACSRGGKDENAACTWDEECTEALWCNQGTCQQKLRSLGEACTDASQCTSGVCENALCVQGRRALGGACDHSAQCSSNNCVEGVCGQPIQEVGVTSATSGNNKPRNSSPSITFNQLMDEDSLREHFTIEPLIEGELEFVTIGEGDDAKTVMRFIPDEPFDSNTTIKFGVGSGAKSAHGDEGYSGGEFEFETGTSLADIARIQILVRGQVRDRDEFICAGNSCLGDENTTVGGNQHRYVLEALASDGSLISDLNNIRWTLDGTSARIPQNATGSAVEVTSTSTNGTAILRASVLRGDNPPRTASVRITTDICHSLWKSSVPTNYDFILSYCRGFTEEGLLPELFSAPVKTDSSDVTLGAFDEEYVFQFRDSEQPSTVDLSNSDVIVLRVAKNESRLSPYGWYLSHIPGSDAPRTLLVDNFQAVRDDAGVYVSAPGIDDNMYIYFLSLNDGASRQTHDIFDELVRRWSLVESIADIDQLDILRRDVLRMADIADIQFFLEEHRLRSQDGALGDRYPALRSGSYLVGQTIQGWPSWQGVLGNALRVALPSDPLFGREGLGDCDGGFDSVTCWNEGAKSFKYGDVRSAVEDEGVHAYSYTSDGASYQLCAQYEDPGRFDIPYCVSP